MNIATTKEDSPGTNISMTPQVHEEDATVTLSKASMENLRKVLGTGLGGYARQGDIVELHKRIGEKFENLPDELARLAPKDNKDDLERIDRLEEVLNRLPGELARLAPRDNKGEQERLDRLEGALNSLEGALRIELAPLLGNTVSEALAQNLPARRRRGAGLLLLAVALVAGTAIGAVFNEVILEQAGIVRTFLNL